MDELERIKSELKSGKIPSYANRKITHIYLESYNPDTGEILVLLEYSSRKHQFYSKLITFGYWK